MLISESWGQEGKQWEAVVSCALPVASTTGMFASVTLPRTAMLVCLVSQNVQSFLTQSEVWLRTSGRPMWGGGWFKWLSVFFFPSTSFYPQLIATTLMMVSYRKSAVYFSSCSRDWIHSFWAWRLWYQPLVSCHWSITVTSHILASASIFN